MFRFLSDLFSPSSERLNEYLTQTKVAISKYLDFLKHGEDILDAISVGADVVDTTFFDIQMDSKSIQYLRDIDAALGRYRFLKNRCVRKGTFPEDLYIEERRLLNYFSQGIQKYLVVHQDVLWYRNEW